MLTAALLAAVAGLLSLLSPCVLPLLPAIIASAFAGHRHGPAYLAFGIALSFAGMGLLTAIAGRWLIFDPEWLRLGTAFIMVIFGVVLLAPPVQAQLAIILAPLASAFTPRMSRRGTGASGQVTLGLLLGAVWGPCVGPTLGAAIVLAARGEDFAAVATTMFASGLGAGLPLFLLSLLPRERFLAAHIPASNPSDRQVRHRRGDGHRGPVGIVGRRQNSRSAIGLSDARLARRAHDTLLKSTLQLSRNT